MSISSLSARSTKIALDNPRHPEHDAYQEWLRSLSMKDRGELILAKCREAAAEERERIAAGLLPTVPEPWPESTWELLRRLARQSRQKSYKECDDGPHE